MRIRPIRRKTWKMYNMDRLNKAQIREASLRMAQSLGIEPDESLLSTRTKTRVADIDDILDF
jgi:hypothetical protein